MKGEGVHLNEATLSDLAERSELPLKLIKPILDLWVEENYLIRTADNLYNLGEREINAKTMLELSGKYEVDGSISGKKRLQAKRKKLASK
jgi:hypothetical protein